MGTFHWGPHGPESSPNEVKPNPTPADPVLPLGEADSYAAQPAAGNAGTSTNPFLSFTMSLLMAPLVWMFWICLYPMTAAAVFTGLLTGSLLSRVLTASDAASVAQLGGVVAGFAAAVIVSRLEYKLAQNSPLRTARHIVRLLLLGALAVPFLQAFVGNTNIAGSPTRHVFAVLTHPQFLAQQLTNPQNLAIAVAVMVAAHFLLWKAERLRSFWHRRLFWIGLK